MGTPNVSRSPVHQPYRALGTVGVPLLGIMLLIIVWIDYHRSTYELAGLDALVVALSAVVIGISYFSTRRVLSRLEDRLDRTMLSVLWRSADSMAIFGYAACTAALGFSHHR